MNKSDLNLDKENIDETYEIDNKVISESREKDDMLYKLYEQNFDKFDNVSKIMKYTQILTYIISFIFLILLIIKLTSKKKFNWLYLSIPELLILLGLIIIVNGFLYLKYLIDKIENNSNSSNFGTIFTFIIINSIGISLSIFSIILMLRLDLKFLVNEDLNLVMIPLYISLILALMFFIFIIPSLISNELYIEIFLYFLDFFSSFIFISLLCSKINSQNNLKEKHKLKYIHCFIPFYISLFGHIFFTFFKFIQSNMEKSKDNNLINKIEKIISLCGFILLFLTGLITQLKLDNKITNSNHYIQGCLFLACFFLFSFENIKSLFFDNEDLENND